MNVRRVALALATLVLLTVSVPAFASPRIVRLSYLAGDVRIDRNKAAGVEHAILNMPVVEGTRIFADSEDARVEIEFENGSTIRMVGPGEINFRQLRLIENGSKQTLVEVNRGIAYFDFKVQNDDDIRVMLRDRDLALRKSSHFRVQVGDPDTTFSVYKGELELQGQSNLVTVRKNETLSLDSNDHERYYLSRSVSALEGDDFDRERNEYRNSYARSDAYRYSGVDYGSPYSYGLNDMAYYGGYAYYPGFGYLWRPAGFGIAWDPFSYGAWSYYPSAGWVFVSAYPWGWTPYRYGNWYNVPGYGWCWGPGGRIGSGWYPVPRYRDPRNYGHGPIPVPISVRPPHRDGGHTVYLTDGGRRPEPRDFALRPNPALGPQGRPHFDPDGRPGRVDDARRGGGGPAGNAIVTPTGGAINTRGNVGPAMNGAVTTPGGAITTQGGAITTRGGALRPVVPGREPDAMPRDRNERQYQHRVVTPSATIGTADAAAGRPVTTATPAVVSPAMSPREVSPREPMRRYDEPRVSDPSQRSAPAMTPQPRMSPPPSIPQEHRSPAMAPSPAPAAAPAIREHAPEPRSPQSFRGSAPPMGGGGMRGPSASFHGGSGMSHGGGMPSGGGHSGGMSAGSRGGGEGGRHR